MVRTTFSEYQGKRIAHLNFAGISKEDEALAAIAEAAKIIQGQPPKSVYTLTNVKDSRFTSAVLGATKKLASENAPFVRAGAVVGMGQLQKAAYLTVMYFSKRNISAFDTEEEAKEWIAKQE
jgi:hypothetical protein